MKGFSHFGAHPRLFSAALFGIAVAILTPDALLVVQAPSGAPAVSGIVTRCLLGWIVGVWSYLAAISLMMWRADKGHLQRIAERQAEGAALVLTLVTAGAVASFGAVVLELAAMKAPGVRPALGHLLLVLFTVTGSWLLVPTLFGLNYASVYFAKVAGKGLSFPNIEKGFEPDYADFLYFSFIIAVACQTADVSITTRHMRQLALLQSVLAFVFNTTILAFSINIAAGLF